MTRAKHKIEITPDALKYDDYENGKLDGFNEGYTQGREDAIIEQAEVVRQQERDKLVYRLQSDVTNLRMRVELLEQDKPKRRWI